MSIPKRNSLRLAVDAILQAEAILIGAGAGMGVDSGLPDFRGHAGFWRAYPPYRRLGLGFKELAQPHWFREDPPIAWGFYGHRLGIYRDTQPHEGFDILRGWAGRMPFGSFVYTSNVDGQFQRAGFDPNQILEIHGAIDRLQCLVECGIGVFQAGPEGVAIDESTMRAQNPLPVCPRCGALARPNILMFGDSQWDDSETTTQRVRLVSWLKSVQGRRVVVIECGAGTAIPSVRNACEEITKVMNGKLIRLNPLEFEVPSGQIGLPLRALDGLFEIREILESDHGWSVGDGLA